MRSVPRFLWGSFRVAMKVALEEIMAGVSRRSEIQQVRGWKLLLLHPRMLLHRPPRGGQIGKSKLIEIFDKFAAGQWQDLLVASVKCSEEAGKLSRRQRRRDQAVEANQVCAIGRFVCRSSGTRGRRVGSGDNSHVEGPPQSSHHTS